MSQIHVPNLDQIITGTDVGGGILALDVNLASGTISFTEGATAADGGTLPAVVKVVGGYDGTNVQVISTDATGAVKTVIPATAATSAKQDTSNTSLSSIDTKVGTGNTSLASIDGKITAVNTGAVVVASSALPSGAATALKQDTGNTSLASIDGKITAVNTGAVVVSSSVLPTGAASLAKQPALGTAGTASADVITIQGIASMTPLDDNIKTINGVVPLMGNGTTGTGSQRVTVASDNTPFAVKIDQTTPGTTNLVAANITKVAGSSVALGSTTGSASFPVVIASDQGAIATKAPVNAAGNSPGSSTVSTVATLTKPANTVGFILMNLDTSTANVRYRLGATATASSGQQLQPGRDTGFVPCASDISICAESGTQNYDVQWILSA